MSDPKSCPFCCSTDIETSVSESKYPGIAATCNECGAEGPAYGSDEAAIAAWNTRPEAADEIIRLREALERLASFETLTTPFAINKGPDGDELLARIEYARTALRIQDEI